MRSDRAVAEAAAVFLPYCIHVWNVFVQQPIRSVSMKNSYEQMLVVDCFRNCLSWILSKAEVLFWGLIPLGMAHFTLNNGQPVATAHRTP